MHIYVQSNDCGLSPILNLDRHCLHEKKEETEPLLTSHTAPNRHWATLYSRFSAECILWFQKYDISQVSSGWKKERFSCFICKPPDSSSPLSPIQETLQGRQCFHERTPWRKISALIWEKGRYLFLSTKPHHQKVTRHYVDSLFDCRGHDWIDLHCAVEMLWLIGWFLWQRENGAVRSSPLLLLSLYIPSAVPSCLEQGVQGSPDVQLINWF